MTRFERFLTPSTAACCLCDRVLTIQELDELRSITDEHLHGEMYCRPCMEESLQLCRECSGRYTADGLCGECAAQEYALAG